MSSSAAPERSRIAALVSEEREAAREQLTAAWQLHVSRIEEQLHAGWREHIAQVFEDRFAEIATRLDEEVRAELEAAVPKARDRARREASEEFNRGVRRLLAHASQEEWAAALLEATAAFSRRALLFVVRGQSLRALRTRGLPDDPPVAGREIPLASAPAFANALESRDPVVTLCLPSELSAEMTSLLAPAAGVRCCLFPILARDRAGYVLYADGGDIDMNGLEGMAALAGAALEIRALVARRTPAPLMTISGPGQRPEAEVPLDWAQLPREEQELHVRAQRFARVRVAEMRLYRSEAVRAGRARQALYAELKEEIDSARAAFEREFVPASPSMVDYLHLELVRTLANEEAARLGNDYPGPLI